MKYAAFILALLCASIAGAQTVTSASAPITVTGNGFQPGDVVNYGGPCITTFVNSSQLTALCPGNANPGVTVTPPCTTSALNVWTPIAFPSQTGNFELQFDATPSTAIQDGVIGIGQTAGTAATGYTPLVAAIRFNDTAPGGFIDARNGAAYAAMVNFPYVPGTANHFTIDFNMTAKTYSVYVGTGSSRVVIAQNYAFRTGTTFTSLASITMIVDEATASSLKLCNLTLDPYPTVAVLWTPGAPVAAAPVTQFQVMRAPSPTGVYTLVGTTTATQFTDLGVMRGQTPCYVVEALGSNGKLSAASVPPACPVVPQ